MWRILPLLLGAIFCGPAVYSVYIDPNEVDYFGKQIASWNGELSDQPPSAGLRLPKDVVPIRYNLTIAVFLPGYGAEINKEDEFTFRGHVEITFENKVPVQEIVLNQKDLTIEHVILIENEGQFKVGDTDDQSQKMTIDVGIIPPGEHRLQISFRSKMREDAEGLFKTEYRDVHGNRRIGAATHMEPIMARTMVPCFDEPEFKATWDVTVIHPEETQALGNQKEIKTERVEGAWKKTSFETTPRMSSYLLAIGVFNFTYYEGYTNRGMRVRIYAAPDQFGLAIALEQSIQCIEGFEKYFGIPIPLPKMDMVAIREMGGAMENWGLIYYGNQFLLGGGLGAADIIAHELAHQWLGNLVTMKWWNQLYLNEGFASLMEVKGLEFIENGKYVKEKKKKLSVIRPLLYLLDIRRESHPIVLNSNENWLFDAITYQKGGAILHMIAKVMGRDKFDQGLRNYLSKYAYQNTEQDDLFAELDEMTTPDQLGPDGKQLNITHFGRQWTLQMGFPRVTLQRINATHCECHQQRFVEEGEEKSTYAKNPYGYKWDIPIWVKRDSDTEFYWLPASGNLTFPCHGRIGVNVDNDAFFYLVR